MKKLSVLSCLLLLAIGLLAPGCKKKEDVSGKEQKSEVKVSAEEAAKASDTKVRKRAPIEDPGRKQKKDVTYTIIEDNSFPGIKRSLVVRLNHKVPEDVLRSIALELKNKDPRKYERTFISYILPGWKKDTGGAWATTHFNPYLEVKILGLTIEQEKSLVSEYKDSSREVVGIWLSDLTASKFTIYRQNGKLYMEEKCKDGSSSNNEMVEKVSSSARRFEEKSGSIIGEYFLIDRQGNLQIFGRDGLVGTARSIN